MNKKASWSLIAGLLVLAIFCFYSFIGIHIKVTENGEHTGTITAIETNGLIFKTNSVYFKTDSSSSQEDKYCLIDKSLLPRMRELQQQKKLATIQYMDYLLPSMKECDYSDNGIIIGVKE